jgi:hypothetical protein
MPFMDICALKHGLPQVQNSAIYSVVQNLLVVKHGAQASSTYLQTREAEHSEPVKPMQDG